MSKSTPTFLVRILALAIFFLVSSGSSICAAPQTPEDLLGSLRSSNGTSNHIKWSQYGNRITFTYDNNVYTVDEHGTRLQDVDGQEKESFDNLEAIEKVRRLYRFGDISPDGSNVVFSTTRYIRERERSFSRFSQHWEIAKSAPDGSNLTRLTQADIDQYVVASSLFPRWSPGGSRIAFLNERSGSEETRMHVMNNDGSNTKIVAPTVLPSPNPPVWSPDGKRIAFLGDQALYIADSDGTTVSRFSGHIINPAWSPDAQKLTYALAQDEDPHIYSGYIYDGLLSIRVMNFKDGVMKDILKFPGLSDLDLLRLRIGGLEWSPDGGDIMFISNATRSGDCLYIVESDGSNIRQITRNFEVTAASWSLDGRITVRTDSMIYTMNRDGSNKKELVRLTESGIRTSNGAPVTDEIEHPILLDSSFKPIPIGAIMDMDQR